MSESKNVKHVTYNRDRSPSTETAHQVTATW
jgi:hypothetical protein